MILQDRWSVTTVVSQDRFHCTMWFTARFEYAIVAIAKLHWISLTYRNLAGMGLHRKSYDSRIRYKDTKLMMAAFNSLFCFSHVLLPFFIAFYFRCWIMSQIHSKFGRPKAGKINLQKKLASGHVTWGCACAMYLINSLDFSFAQFVLSTMWR